MTVPLSKHLGIVTLRWTIACASLLALAITFGVVLYLYRATDPLTLDSQRVNDQTDRAVAIRLSMSTTLFQMGVVVTGALWGLLLAKKNEVRIVWRDYQELLAFLSASCLLFTSFLAHYLYSTRISDAYFLAGQLTDATQEVNENAADGNAANAIEMPNNENAADGNAANAIEMPNVVNPPISHLFTCQIISFLIGLVVSIGTFISAHWLRETEHASGT